MDATTLVVTIGTAIVGASSAVLVARYQYRRASREEISVIVAEQLKASADKLDARITALEHSEPEDVADLRTALDLLAKDVAAVRASLQSHLDSEERRRSKAREMAIERERDTMRQLTELTGIVKRLQERMADLLDAAGGFRGIARGTNAK